MSHLPSSERERDTNGRTRSAFLASADLIGGATAFVCGTSAWARPLSRRTGRTAMLSIVLLIVLILLLAGALPTWGYSRSWGYAPSGLLGVVLIIVIILALMGRLPF